MNLKFDSADKLSMVVWQARLADMPRGENRAVLNRCYNGEPPFDQSKEEENAIQVNRNFLQGTRLLTDARRQWYSALLKPGNYFTVGLDDGPAHKRMEWSHTITTQINRRLKRSQPMMEQIRATGAQVMLHGIGPTVWKDRRDPIPVPIPIASLLIPSETDLDFSNLEWYAVFREWTPSQLYAMTHGPKLDPGWNMKLVSSQLKYVAEQTMKQPNVTAYQYMPERIEELIKQDSGFWGSDAVPTIDVWDCYFRQVEDGKGWYRRIFLDWDLGKDEMNTYRDSGGMPSNNDNQSDFLYTSGNRQYSSKLSEMLHCQFGDCSAVAPYKYHSVRSLGWMMWGVVDLLNRFQCKGMESNFEQLLWFFRTAGQQDFDRIKKAVFSHMAVIPQGVSFIPANERFKPDPQQYQQALGMLRQILSENAASYVQDFDQGGSGGKEMTATETMARVNNVNTMVSGMLNLAYTYQTSQYREIARRFCIKNSPYQDVQAFRKGCLRAGVPEEFIDSERWDIEPERTLGGGNKTLEIAQANQLLQMRQFLGPDAQRKVDHIAVEVFTDDPSLAEDLAPTDSQVPISKSQHDAQLSTERILRGLQFDPMPDMVFEDYVQVWLKDMAATIQIIQQTGMPTMQDIIGLGNLATHIQKFIQAIGGGQTDQPRLKQYSDMLGQLMNHVKAMAQQLQQAQGQQQGQDGNGEAALTQGKVQAMLIQAQAKAKNAETSHAQRTAQKQASWELDNQRKDSQLQAELRREDTRTAQELSHEQARTGQQLAHEGALTAAELRANTAKTLQEIAGTAAKQAAEPKTTETTNE